MQVGIDGAEIDSAGSGGVVLFQAAVPWLLLAIQRSEASARFLKYGSSFLVYLNVGLTS